MLNHEIKLMFATELHVKGVFQNLKNLSSATPTKFSECWPIFSNSKWCIGLRQLNFFQNVNLDKKLAYLNIYVYLSAIPRLLSPMSGSLGLFQFCLSRERGRYDYDWGSI